MSRVRALALTTVVVAACGPAVEPGAPDAFMPDAVQPWTPVRPGVASTLVGDRVAWTVESPACPLESGGCPSHGPSVLTANVDGTDRVVHAASPRGAGAIAGDDDRLFALLRVDEPFEHDRLVRLSVDGGRADTVVASLQREVLAIDDAAIYWVADGGGIWRTSRDGDGSDAAEVVPAVFPEQLAVDGDFLFWLEDGALRRAPAGGGAVETWLDGMRLQSFTVGAGVAYVGTYPAAQVLRVDGPDSTTVLADAINFTSAMRLDGDDLFWLDGGPDRLRTIPTTGGIARTIAQPVRRDFVVTPDAILHEFTDIGFATLPR